MKTTCPACDYDVCDCGAPGDSECAHEDEACGCADERATGLEYEAAMQRAGYR